MNNIFQGCNPAYIVICPDAAVFKNFRLNQANIVFNVQQACEGRVFVGYMESLLLGSEASGSLENPLSKIFAPHESPYFTQRNIKRKLYPSSSSADLQSLEQTRDAAQDASTVLPAAAISMRN